jgi:predicted MFS family arabinose efflux permease
MQPGDIALVGLAVLAPFRVRSFRRQWPADLLTACAFEMETLILGWYVLVETGSVLLLTLFGAIQYGGTLVAPLFGVVGDRIGHRNLLCLMRVAYVVLSTTLMAVAFHGALSPLIVFVVASLTGMVRPSDLGVRLALVADNVAADQLVAAMGIARTTSDCARIGGALAGAGLFAAFGIGPAYVAVVSFYVLGLALSLSIAPAPRKPALRAAGGSGYRPPSAWRELREGIAYVLAAPRLLTAMLLAFLANLTAYPLSNGLLPYVAREIYGIDQTGLGYLVAGFASGALMGSLAVSTRGSINPSRTMLLFTLVWYAMLLVFAQMREFYSGFVMLMLAGFAQSFCMVTLTVLLLRNTKEAFRGRVMGVRMLAIYSLPLGLIASGALIDLVGFQATATLYACIGLLFTLVIAVRWRADLWRLEAPAKADHAA